MVTGGTGGIGKEIARALAGLGARVIVTGRDPHRAATVVDELRVGTGNPAVDAVCADITRQRDLRALARAVTDRCGSLYALVNNAGVNPARRELTEDGVETAFAGNVLAPYLLTRLLLPALERTRRDGGGVARVVNTAGGVPRGRLDPDNLQAEKAFSGWVTDTQYNRSKLAMMAMTRTLAERVDAAGAAVVVAYPGHAHTEMNRSLPLGAYPRLLRPVVPLLKPLMPVLWGDAAAPARNAVRLVGATDAEARAAHAHYLGLRGRFAPWPAATDDPLVRERIWRMCERLTTATGPA